jgi:hypothetical protein
MITFMVRSLWHRYTSMRLDSPQRLYVPINLSSPEIKNELSNPQPDALIILLRIKNILFTYSKYRTYKFCSPRESLISN